MSPVVHSSGPVHRLNFSFDLINCKLDSIKFLEACILRLRQIICSIRYISGKAVPMYYCMYGWPIARDILHLQHYTEHSAIEIWL